MLSELRKALQTCKDAITNYAQVQNQAQPLCLHVLKGMLKEKGSLYYINPDKNDWYST